MFIEERWREREMSNDLEMMYYYHWTSSVVFEKMRLVQD
jgi:hypothetical protein